MVDDFFGRATEQDSFRRVLDLAGGAADGPDEAYVVLVHGLGGIGKSELLRRLHEAAGQRQRGGPLVAGIVDCEYERRRNPVDYAGQNGPPIWRLLDQLYAAVRAGAAGRRLESRVERAFAGFRQAMAVQPELLHRASELGIGAPFGRRRLSAEQISTLVQAAGGAAHMAGLAVPGAAALADPLARTAQIAMNAAELRRDGRVDVAAYDALVADLDGLVSKFADALKEVSHRAGPVVMFIDTGELLGGTLDWLRDAMRRSGRAVVWVLGLRLETESDAGFDSEAVWFHRSIPDTRLWPMELARFDDRTVAEYLRSRLGTSYPADLDIEAVAQLTHGIPLAVFLVSKLLASGQDPATALAPVRDGDVSRVVRDLARRYLVHALTSPALKPDLRLLYGLALLYGDTGRAAFPGAGSRGGQLDPDALSALWDVPAGEVAARLDGLAARHDFVLSGSRRLHQEVREAVLLFLLDPVERPAVREMNTRAAAHYRARAASADHPTVVAQVTDQRWQTAVISLLWHIFWTDLDQGLETLSRLFAAAVTLDEAFAAAMLRVAAFFAPACPADCQRLISGLQLVARMLSGLQLMAQMRRPGPAGSIRDVIEAVTKRAAEPLLATAPPVAVYHDLLLRRAGQSALMLGHFDHAVTIYTRALELNREDAQAWYGQGKAFAGMGDFSRAVESYRASLDRASNFFWAWYDLGLTQLKLRDFAQADISLGRAQLLRDSDHNTSIARARALQGSGDLPGAYREYQSALALRPNAIAALRGRAEVLSLLPGPPPEPVGLGAEPSPDDHDSWFQRGNLLLRDGKAAEAAHAFQAALACRENNADAWHRLGLACTDGTGPEDPVACYERALRIDPYYYWAHFDLGNARRIAGDHKAALGHYDSAISCQRDNPDAWYGKALSLAALGRHREAVQHYKQALQLDPDFPAISYDLGNSLRELGYAAAGACDSVAAEEYFRQGVQAYQDELGKGDHAGAIYGLGLCYIELGLCEDAVAQFDDLIAADPDAAWYWYDKGRALSASGRHGDAVAAFRRAIELRSPYLQALYEMARAEARQGHVGKAVEALESAVRLCPELDPDNVRTNPAFENLRGDDRFGRLFENRPARPVSGGGQ